MGGCQGKPWNYGCECRVAQIIARENQMEADAVGRRPWKGTSQFERRWLTDDDKAKLVELSAAGPPAPTSLEEVNPSPGATEMIVDDEAGGDEVEVPVVPLPEVEESLSPPQPSPLAAFKKFLQGE
jgi:hypothetical protein